MQLPSCAESVHKFPLHFTVILHFTFYIFPVSFLDFLVFFCKNDGSGSKIVRHWDLDTHIFCDEDENDPARMVLDVRDLRNMMGIAGLLESDTFYIALGNAQWGKRCPEDQCVLIDISNALPFMFIAGLQNVYQH